MFRRSHAYHLFFFLARKLFHKVQGSEVAGLVKFVLFVLWVKLVGLNQTN
jgi:hypothetical protein